MHYSARISSRADHYRQQAIAARQRAAQALDQLPVKAAYEEVANYWNALAEEVEWLERGGRTGSRAIAWRGCRMLLSVAALGLVGFAILVVIGLWDRRSLETKTFEFSGGYEHYRATSAAARVWQAVDSRQTWAIEE